MVIRYFISSLFLRPRIIIYQKYYNPPCSSDNGLGNDIFKSKFFSLFRINILNRSLCTHEYKNPKIKGTYNNLFLYNFDFILDDVLLNIKNSYIIYNRYRYV